MRGPRRLYLRLYLAFLGVLLAVVICAALIHLFTGRPLSFRAGPRVAAHLARTLPPLSDRAALQRAVKESHDELQIDVEVLDADGAKAASAGEPLPPLDDRDLLRARGTPTWLGPRGLAGAPLRGGGAVVVRLPFPDQARPTLWRPLMLLFATLLVSLLLVYPLARSITSPVERLTSAAEAFGKGELSARSQLDGDDEVGRLGRAFDEMADRIQAARRAEKELLANASHELRTPLARLRVAMELLDPRDPAAHARVVSMAEEIDELERLIADVLAASRLDLSAQPLRREPVPLHELVEKSAARLRKLAPAQEVRVLAEPLVAQGDPALLARAFDNLADNARKYGEGSIELEARAGNGELLLSVRDRGPGIPADELERIFEPFFRGRAVRTQAGGFGLGLALARRVALAHGGSLSAVNEPEGGARFVLRLPA